MNRQQRKIPIKIAFVGLGRRGIANMNRYLKLHDTKVAILCDFSQEAIHAALSHFPADYPAPLCYHSWQEMLMDMPDIDLVYLSTEWGSHAPIAISAMQAGYDVAVEVPAVIDAESGRRLINTVEETGRFYTMLENCCYDPFHLSTMALVEAGLLGEITHCEGAYIHDLRNDHESGSWLSMMSGVGEANPYPTHALGPICKLLGVEKGNDRLKQVISLSPAAPGINTSMIHTEKGRSILIQFDVVTPRPYSRLQTVCGTKGYVSKYPTPMAMFDGMDQPLTGDALKSLFDRHRHPLLEAYEADGLRLGVSNMMNYIMDRRLIDLLLGGKDPDITVKDAVEWSSLAWLSRASLANAGAPVKFPSW